MEEEGRGANFSLLDRLRRRNPSNVAELLVPGLRTRPPDDPIRQQLAGVNPDILFAAVKAAKAAALPEHRRVVRGCLMCTEEMSVESMQPVVEAFEGLAKRRKQKRRRQARQRRPALTRGQQKLLLTSFYNDDQSETQTLCVMHMFKVFHVTEANLRTMKSERDKVIAYGGAADDDEQEDEEEQDGEKREGGLADLVREMDRVGDVDSDNDEDDDEQGEEGYAEELPDANAKYGE